MDLPVRVQKELLVCYDVANLDKLSGRRAAAVLNVAPRTLRTLLANRRAVEAAQADGRALSPRPSWSARGYGPDDVYCSVETGLYTAAEDGRPVPRLAVLFVCNATGTDRKRPAVWARPGAGGLVSDVRAVWPADAASWSACPSFAAFLRRWDARAGRNVLLVPDGRSALPAVPLRNIEIGRLPAGVAHPLGLSIARTAERRRRRHNRWPADGSGRCDRHCERYCDAATVAETLDALLDAWRTVTPELIRNCYRTAGIDRAFAAPQVKRPLSSCSENTTKRFFQPRPHLNP